MKIFIHKKEVYPSEAIAKEVAKGGEKYV